MLKFKVISSNKCVIKIQYLDFQYNQYVNQLHPKINIEIITRHFPKGIIGALDYINLVRRTSSFSSSPVSPSSS